MRVLPEEEQGRVHEGSVLRVLLEDHHGRLGLARAPQGLFSGKGLPLVQRRAEGREGGDGDRKATGEFEFQVLNARDMAEVGRIIGECGEWAEGLKDRNL